MPHDPNTIDPEGSYAHRNWYRRQCRDAVAKARNAEQALMLAVEEYVRELDGMCWLDATMCSNGRSLRSEIALVVLESVRDYEGGIAREQRECADD